MKSRRAGNGCSSGVAPTEPLCVREVEARSEVPGQATTLGEVPGLAAAIERAREDVRAHEQTEQYWRGVWGVERPEGDGENGGRE